MNFKMDNFQIKILSKKLLKIGLKALIKIFHECEYKVYTSPKIIEKFLNREPNHIANILKGLELDDLITRKREGFESKISLTDLGRQVATNILHELEVL